MLKNDLRNPIVKTVLLIAAITLIILFSFNAPPGSGVLGTLTAVFSGIFTTIKVIIGLLVAFAVSFFLFVVIFSLSVAIISRADAVKVINSVFNRLIGKNVLPQRQPELREAPVSPPPKEGVVREEKQVAQEREEQEKGLEDALQEYLESHLKPLRGADEKLHDEIASLQARLSSISEEMKELKEDKRVGDLEAAVGALRADIDSLQKGTGDLKKELDQVKKQTVEVAAVQKKQKKEAVKVEETQETEEAPRIFEYLSRKNDRKKLAELTAKTVEQGMSYAEATDFIISNMPKEASSIVEAHPSLTKEYIKSCREAAQ